MTAPVITPTVGRRIWYWPSEADLNREGVTQIDDAQPFDAGVVFVWGDRMVNLDVTDHAGKHRGITSVRISDEKEAGCAQWMPYQVKAAS